MAAVLSNIRVFELAEALRSSIEREMSTKFTVYLPVEYEAKENDVHVIKVRTQDGHLHLTVQQRNPGELVRYMSHRFVKLSDD